MWRSVFMARGWVRSAFVLFLIAALASTSDEGDSETCAPGSNCDASNFREAFQGKWTGADGHTISIKGDRLIDEGGEVDLTFVSSTKVQVNLDGDLYEAVITPGKQYLKWDHGEIMMNMKVCAELSEVECAGKHEELENDALRDGASSSSQSKTEPMPQPRKAYPKHESEACRWTMIKADSFCSIPHLIAEEGKTLEECQREALAESQCGHQLFSNGDKCYCVKAGETCEFYDSESGSSVYEYQCDEQASPEPMRGASAGGKAVDPLNMPTLPPSPMPGMLKQAKPKEQADCVDDDSPSAWNGKHSCAQLAKQNGCNPSEPWYASVVSRCPKSCGTCGEAKAAVK